MFSVLWNCFAQALLVLGTICGLVLMTLCSWTIMATWNYFMGIKEVPVKPPTGLKGLTIYLGGGLLYAMDCVFCSMYNLLVMPAHMSYKMWAYLYSFI